MPSDEREEPLRERRTRVPVATLLKALLPTLAATAVVVFLVTRPTTTPQTARADGMRRVTLSQKDSAFHVVSPSVGGATGLVWYAPTGSALHFQLRASGLPPGRPYLLELQVDDAIFDVASYSPTARGDLAIDTTLSRFEEGVCVGANFDPSRPTAGRHRIKFWVKRDGSPSTGTMPGLAPTAPGAQLACRGNGDGNYGYVLLENDVADFTGSDTAVRDSSKQSAHRRPPSGT